MPWCDSCEKVVVVAYELDCDEDGTEYEMPICSVCGCIIRKCHDCGKWKPDSEDTPLGKTEGSCSFKKQRIHAMELVCGKVSKLEKET